MFQRIFYPRSVRVVYPQFKKIYFGVVINKEMNNNLTRREKDTMGEVEVPYERYWGAQTQRSLVSF